MANNASATFNYFVYVPGVYDIEMCAQRCFGLLSYSNDHLLRTWRADNSRALNVPITITAGNAVVHLLVDQREALGIADFKLLATMDLEAGLISVVLGTTNLEGGEFNTDPIVIADAVRFVRRPFVPMSSADAGGHTTMCSLIVHD